MTLADQYFIKAHEEYPWSIEATLENLQYALSYDPEHVDANYLMGRVMFEEFERFEDAEEYFQAALGSQPRHHKTGMEYARLLLRMQRYPEAKKLLTYIETLVGVDPVALGRLWAQFHEMQGQLEEALAYLQRAQYRTMCVGDEEDLTAEIERVQRKQRMGNPFVYVE